jgi:CRISPR-associated protein Csb2
MLTIKIELIANRYHANPWNRAHVEGVVEWPPSPWRLLRAILAGGFLAKVDENRLKALVAKLAQETPSYYLPPSSYTQTRSPRKDETQSTDLYKPGKDIVDAYLNFDSRDSSIWVTWSDLDIDDSETLLLTKCLAYCRYLGRREADAVWTIADEEKPPNAYPDPSGTVQVACSDGTIENLLLSPYEVLAKERRSTVPGLIYKPYRIESEVQNPLEVKSTYHRADLKIRSKGKLKAELFLVWADKLHQSLIAKLGKTLTSNFSGCDKEGKPLTSHEHVFIQPVFDEGELVGFTLSSFQGFSEGEIEALYLLRSLWINQSTMIEIRVVGLSPNYGDLAKEWKSVTPFLLTRYPLLRNGHPRWIANTHYQKDGAEHQALKALCYLPQFDIDPKDCTFREDHQGLMMLYQDEVIATATAEIWPDSTRWKSDRKHGKRTLMLGFSVQITFPAPKCIVIGIGNNAHFGFGCLFPK